MYNNQFGCCCCCLLVFFLLLLLVLLPGGYTLFLLHYQQCSNDQPVLCLQLQHVVLIDFVGTSMRLPCASYALAGTHIATRKCSFDRAFVQLCRFRKIYAPPQIEINGSFFFLLVFKMIKSPVISFLK